MSEIIVHLGERSYRIYVAGGVVQRSGELIDQAGFKGIPLFIVTDENVAVSRREDLEALQNLNGHRSVVATIPPGEDSKSIAWFSTLMDKLAAFEDGDGVLVVAFGGGVVGDLSGFVAACYKRGVAWIQIPTTLLAQVDASVGGKCAINHPSAKNLIGSFHQPSMVLADVNMLRTLPSRELRGGLSEVIKHGVIADRDFFERIEKSIQRSLDMDTETLSDYVASSCRIKASMVEADERDNKGKRAILNYGHTFGHAIEIASHFSYSHGEAVAIGMLCAGDMACALGIWNKEEAQRVENLITMALLPTKGANVSVDQAMTAMKLDKKFLHGYNRFVLAETIGRVIVLTSVNEEVVKASLIGRLN